MIAVGAGIVCEKRRELWWKPTKMLLRNSGGRRCSFKLQRRGLSAGLWKPVPQETARWRGR